MQDQEIITWSSVPYDSRGKSVDWYWLLGFIVFVSVGAALYFGNYSFAAVLLLSGVVLFLYSNVENKVEIYTLSKSGISITEKDNTLASTFYKFNDIRSFYIFNSEVEGKARLMLTLRKTFFTHRAILLGNADTEAIRTALRKVVLEKEQLPSLSDKVMEVIKF